MTLIQITSTLHLGSVADFGNGVGLGVASVALVVSCHGHANFPHGPASIQSVECAIKRDGTNPAWYIRGVVDILGRAYGVQVMAVCDESGGLNEGAFLIGCTFAEKGRSSYAAGIAWLDSQLPSGTRTAVSSALATLGATLWPAG